MELTSLQKEKVDDLLSLYHPQTPTKIDFKAPTGSGKTLMATAFISGLIAKNPTENFVFVIATPSSSDLPFSFEQKILHYKQDLSFSDFDVEYVKSPSEIGKNKLKTDATIKLMPEINKVFIFGKSSFGKDRILTTRHIIDDFVNIIKDKGYKLIYIRDEAHIGGDLNKDKDENFEFLMQNNADMVIKMTATPSYNDNSIHKVVLTEEDLNNPIKNEGKYLLKTHAVTLLKGSMNDEDMLKDAISKFKIIKNEYRELEKDGVYIRPAMLIQVDNDSNKDLDKSQKFQDTLNLIEKKLKEAGLSYARYFGENDKFSNTIYKEKFNLYELSKNESDFDVIIFKIGPATGWDIPRACLLLQLRNVCSEGLNIQTIGRIKRNSYKNLEKNEITDKYYIYSNAPQDNNFVILNARVKDKFSQEEFMSIEITNVKDCSKKVSKQGLQNDINKYLQTNKDKIFQLSKTIFTLKNNQLIYKDTHISIAGGEYYSEISNIFQFTKLYLRLKESNSYIFEKCEIFLSDFWKANFYDKFLYKTFPYTKEMFYITLIQKCRNDLLNIINKNKQYKPKYKIVSSPYTPQIYTEFYTNIPHEEKTRIHSYLFETKLGNKDNSQPIGQNDSSPEVVVFNKISNIDYDEECISVWCKNFTTSNVNGAYLDKFNNLRHSYFDFIIKFKNKALLYIEVKGEKDINSEKTEVLKGAYKEYFNKQNITIFDKPVVISIFKVNTSNGDISQTSFYDETLFQKDLNTLSVDELIKEISSLKNNVI